MINVDMSHVHVQTCRILQKISLNITIIITEILEIKLFYYKRILLE